MSNQILPFCPTDSGTNLLTNAEYAADAGRTSGNQPGIARSKLVNKAIRQSSMIASALSQYVADLLGQDVVDAGNTNTLFLAQLNASMHPFSPEVLRVTNSGAGTFNTRYKFFIASGNATVAATYTNNGVTYTVTTTIAAGLILTASGNADPLTAGTLTKTSGTGDATLAFSAFKKPLYLIVEAQGAGGGGGGSGTTNGTAGTDGGNTTLAAILSAGGGTKGSRGSTPGNGGNVLALAAPAIEIFSRSGNVGNPGLTQGGTPISTGIVGGQGGSSNLSGGGYSGGPGTVGGDASGYGGGGGGAGGASTANVASGSGGGGGAYLKVLIPTPLSIYTFSVGLEGDPQLAGTSGQVAGSGTRGILIFTMCYQ